MMYAIEILAHSGATVKEGFITANNAEEALKGVLSELPAFQNPESIKGNSDWHTASHSHGGFVQVYLCNNMMWV